MYAFGSVSHPLHLSTQPGCPPPPALPPRGTTSEKVPCGYCGYSSERLTLSKCCWSRSFTRHKFSTATCIEQDTFCPLPISSRCINAVKIPMARCMPVLQSPNAAAETVGGPSQNPVVDAAPPAHCATFS